MPLNVLYLQHVGAFGGSSKSMFEMIKAFPEKTVHPYLISPVGSVNKYASELRIENLATVGISQFDNSRHGHYRNFRWLILLREIFYLPFTFLILLKARRSWKNIDIIHINEITMLPGLLICRMLFKQPIVLHCRTLFHNVSGFRRKIFTDIVKKNVALVIAIDETVKKTLPKELSPIVVHNGFDPRKLVIEEKEKTPQMRSGRFSVAMVGSLIRYKGVHEFIESAAICKEKQLSIDFLLIGDAPKSKKGLSQKVKRWLGLEHNIREELVNMIEEKGLKDYVRFVPFTTNVKEIYDAIDVLCFPSHLNAAGRPVFEAAYSRVPSIVAIDNPDNDTIMDGITGLCIKPKDSMALANAIAFFYNNPEQVKKMGEQAYLLAVNNFDSNKNALEVLDIYKSLIKN
ncbi:glycosyltransferase family 4 protein [Chitinophaga defluvii]|uniref:Glycosyltransferase family 4 protein n=1 Tax=Chitinophaga defluvii TaxID=3163343 RepID=A0ABV2T0Q0_9BACT